MSEAQTDLVLIECPADGCNYAGVESSVLAHYSGKRDDDHEGGYGYAQALVRLDRD